MWDGEGSPVLNHLSVRPGVARSLYEHAEREAPVECCGLLSGDQGIIDRHHPLPNVSDRPRSRYFAEPRALFDALQEIRAGGSKLLGIYHSHPCSEPAPSPTDVEQAFYPECAYLIIGLGGVCPRLRAFRIVAGKSEAMSIVWTDS
jgi:proteasome lid subunit RPN8/RPN11